jgi:site-specific recombinase XerD
MTQHVRSLKNAAAAPSSWRDLRSPPAANDIQDSLVPLSRSLPKSAEEIAALRAVLDLKQATDLRAAALLVLLGLGLRKREIVALDLSDVVLVGSVVCVSVRARARRARDQETFLPVIGADAKVLKQYLLQQHDEAAALTSPLFYNIEHGQTDRLRRIAASGISYWLLELRMRARQQKAAAKIKPRRSAG